MAYFLGFDGGGTKTECILLDSHGHQCARGLAGPSNATRIGFEPAFANLWAAADQALTDARVELKRVRGVCAGLAGAGSRRVVERMTNFLGETFPNAEVRVATDCEVALEAAAGPAPGVILIAGTGSVAFGRNAAGRTARAGGMGPWISDEGSAFDIGRRAVIAVARARDALGPATQLAEMIPSALEIHSWEGLIERIPEAPDQVFPRVFPLVVKAAERGDGPAREILLAAAEKLSRVAASVIKRLHLGEEKFVLAKSGGVFGRSRLLDESLDALLAGAAPHAQVKQLDIPPALGAARWAMRLVGSARGKAHGHKP